MKKAVIFGAGQTGRGYTARFLNEQGYEITFADINDETISKLNEDKKFSIHFYDQDRTPFLVDNFKAFNVQDKDLLKAIEEADMIHTSVGEQNLKDVAQIIAKGVNPAKTYILMTNENGINPAKVLREHLKSLGVDNVIVSQTAVFCSTINIAETRLDILSQNMDYYPYDCDELKEPLLFTGAKPVHNFEGFLKRKIYTYNCLAGIISYFGYLRGFEVFGDAANDSEISDLMDELLEELNPALASYFDISMDEQVAFSKSALEKFKNKNIIDFVVKNGRDARRKLGSTERIIAPLNIIKNFDSKGDTRILEFNAAAALCYWEELVDNGREHAMEPNAMQSFEDASGISKESEIGKRVEIYLEKIKSNRNHIQLKDLIHSVEK